MMNVLATYADDLFYLKVIPRKKHRPDIFYAEDADRIRISPACVDLSGLLVVPFQEDFDRITNEILEIAFNEVCLTDLEFEKLTQQLKNERNG